eukprot:359568-Chlamydomonas_euryale.AAC.2
MEGFKSGREGRRGGLPRDFGVAAWRRDSRKMAVYLTGGQQGHASAHGLSIQDDKNADLG